MKWIFASPQFHHWHHANEREAYDNNFAAQLSVIDLLGGTLFMSKGTPAKYGVDDPIPDFYHEQLAYPFMRKQPQPQPEASASIEGAQ